MRWSIGQTVGLTLIAAGIVSIGMARHYMAELSQARRKVNRLTKPFATHPFGAIAERSMLSKVDEYDQQVQLLFYGGIAAVVVGGLSLIVFIKKR